jgi:hypothetical protein
MAAAPARIPGQGLAVPCPGSGAAPVACRSSMHLSATPPVDICCRADQQYRLPTNTPKLAAARQAMNHNFHMELELSATRASPCSCRASMPLKQQYTSANRCPPSIRSPAWHAASC